MRCIKHVVFALACAIPLSCTNGSGSIDQATESDHGDDDGDHDCVFTQGYWKNHPEAWPVQSLALGGHTYTQDELLAIFHTPVKGNGLVSLAHQLIAAKLNVANGGAVSINASIEAADRLIGDLVCPPVGEGHLKTKDTSDLVDKLDGYNNDGTCEGGDDDCDHDCPQPPACGDGHVDGGETCDDGNTTGGDGCSSTCQHEDCPTTPVCGDGHQDSSEECDDGNTAGGDGCSATCTIEELPHPCCGDGHVDAGETCDDGNLTPGDGCSEACQIEAHVPACGDGHVDSGETCDDGNTTAGDGCSATCQIEHCPTDCTICNCP